MTPFRCFTVRVFVVAFLLTSLSAILPAQSNDARITGIVTDPSKAVIPGAKVDLVNVDTGVRYPAITNGSGIYTVSSQVGNYRIEVEHVGFKTVIAPGIVLHTQDVLEINFEMAVGSASESVTVNAGATNDSPAVSMTVTREFIENMPLNGQSLQDLIQLSPGTVAAANPSQGNFGFYTINGQRTDANISTVDGVSANLTGVNSYGSTLANDLPMQTALGTTQSLASIDSLQEFKIQTSGYTAEYGRSPGGQIQFTTRSGTNDIHGTLFDYLRNTIFDANSDSNDYHNDPKTAEHQNDFGGTLGGPLVVPHLYDGKNNTFYFFSYEGLRLITPANESEYVPTQAFRNAASPNVQPFLNTAPLPNPSSTGNNDGCTVTDPSTGATSACDALFYYGYSSPSQLDNISLRLDQTLRRKMHAFIRYADTPSSKISGAETTGAIGSNAHSWTVGLTANLTTNLLDDLRFNFSRLGEEQVESEKSVGGSVPLQRSLLIPAQYESTYDGLGAYIQVPGSSLSRNVTEYGDGSVQGQYQLVDGLTWTRGKHNLKFGADWRRIVSTFSSDPYSDDVDITSLAAIQQGYATSVQTGVDTPTEPVLHNLSVYAQDHWNLRRRLSIDYGLRWEFNPAPGPANGEYPAVLTSSNLATAELAPLGTQPYKSRYDKFAPRFGFAWNAIPSRRYALTVRGGFGIFYDTGQAVIVNSYEGGYPFAAYNDQSGDFSLPLSSAVLAPPIPPSSMGTLAPPYQYLGVITSTDQTLPYTEQWNLSLDEALNARNTFTISYVGNTSKKLLFSQAFDSAPYGNQDFSQGLVFTSNASSSSYHALQVQDVGRILNGLDIVGSFTYAHARDNASSDYSYNVPQWGNSDDDLRKVLNLALNYQIPAESSNRWMNRLTSGWLLANRFAVQSGYPLNLQQTVTVLTNGIQVEYYPDLVSGVPIYLHGNAANLGGKPAPGSWRLNPAAFSTVPTDPTTGNPVRQGTLGRNYVRTPPFWALNTSLQRSFPIHEQLHFNFRVDAFNIFNHPNLGDPDTYLPDSTFGELLFGSVTTIGTPNALYAMGAARSLQFSLKLQF